ncbi:MAG: hypothetical protein WBN79_07520, partial [Gemmatimonadota bacterium]
MSARTELSASAGVRSSVARGVLAGAIALALLATDSGELIAQDTGLSKSELVRVVVSPDPAAQKLET